MHTDKHNLTNRKTLQIGLQGPWQDMSELPIFTPLACIMQGLYVAFVFVKDSLVSG